MMPIERLHIDELKRVEKQTTTLLKSWRSLKNDYEQLEKKQETLEKNEVAQAEQHKNQLFTLQSSHEQTLADKENDWQNRFNQQNEELTAFYEEKIAILEKQLADSKKDSQKRLAEMEKTQSDKIQQLEKKLEKEQMIKAEMIARIRGVV